MNIIVKFLPATDFKGARWSVRTDLEGYPKKIYSYKYRGGPRESHDEGVYAASSYLKEVLLNPKNESRKFFANCKFLKVDLEKGIHIFSVISERGIYNLEEIEY